MHVLAIVEDELINPDRNEAMRYFIGGRSKLKDADFGDVYYSSM